MFHVRVVLEVEVEVRLNKWDGTLGTKIEPKYREKQCIPFLAKSFPCNEKLQV